MKQILVLAAITTLLVSTALRAAEWRNSPKLEVRSVEITRLDRMADQLKKEGPAPTGVINDVLMDGYTQSADTLTSTLSSTLSSTRHWESTAWHHWRSRIHWPTTSATDTTNSTATSAGTRCTKVK